jgi:hypothetical protein
MRHDRGTSGRTENRSMTAWSDYVGVVFWNEISITQNMHPAFLLEIRSREAESSSGQSLGGKGGAYLLCTSVLSGASPQPLHAFLSQGHFPLGRRLRKRRLQCQIPGRGWRTLHGWKTQGVSARHHAWPKDRIKKDILTWDVCK